MTFIYRRLTSLIWWFLLLFQAWILFQGVMEQPPERWTLGSRPDLLYSAYHHPGFPDYSMQLLLGSLAFLGLAWVFRLIIMAQTTHPDGVGGKALVFTRQIGWLAAALVLGFFLSRSLPGWLYYEYVYQPLAASGPLGIAILVLFGLIGGMMAGPAFRTLWFLWVFFVYRDPGLVFYCSVPSLVGDFVELGLVRVRAEFVRQRPNRIVT